MATTTPSPSGTIISTPPVKSSPAYKIIIFVALIILILLSMSKKIRSKGEDNSASTLDSQPGIVITIPAVTSTTKTYTLKQGMPVRVMNYEGYTYSYFGGDKQYYIKPQNSDSVLVGSTSCNTLKLGKVKFVDLIYYNEQIEVTVEETKKIRRWNNL